MKNNLYLFLFLFIIYRGYGQTCPSDIIITTTNYTNNVTESNSYIVISSSINNNEYIKLNANHFNGYVLMNAGFSASPSSSGSFIATSEYECINQTYYNRENSIFENNFNLEIIIYPNPTKNIINISFGKTINTNSSFSLYDSSGKLTIKETLQKGLNTYRIDITHLPSGAYTYKIIYDKYTKNGVILKT